MVEQPASATSWQLKEMKELMQSTSAHLVSADLCAFGLTTRGQRKGLRVPARKPTRFLTNSAEIAHALNKKCPGGHTHQALLGGRAKAAAEYTEELCRAVCKGLMRQMKDDSEQVKMLLSLNIGDKVREVPEEEDLGFPMSRAWDDVSGKELDAAKVMRARQEEIEYVNFKKVWHKIPRKQALTEGIKIIGSRWIDVDKGDLERPNYRSRLVG